jgi:hypothetical protein
MLILVPSTAKDRVHPLSWIRSAFRCRYSRVRTLQRPRDGHPAASSLPRNGHQRPDAVRLRIYIPVQRGSRAWRPELTHRCQHCGGRGKRIARQCPKCSGQKVIDTLNTLAVHIPAGAPEGFEEVFHGEADESTEWEAGDVVVRVHSRKVEGQGGWGRKDAGIVGRVTLSVAEVSIIGSACHRVRYQVGTEELTCRRCLGSSVR